MLNSLQALRAVAAYMVVTAHCLSILYFIVPGTPHILAGEAGVDIFFVISGFIMVYVAGVRGTPAGFMANRIARIVPLYWATTFATIVAVTIRPWMFPYGRMNWQTVLESLAFVPARNADGAFFPIMPVGWTLNWEMMFYALFAISMFAARRFRMTILLGLMIGVFAVGIAAPQDWPLTFYGSPIIFEFAAGCLIATALQKSKIVDRLKHLPHWGLIGLGAMVIAASSLVGEINGWTRLLLWGIPAMLIVTGVVLRDLKRPTAKAGFLQALGDASYSAYLLHSFINAIIAPEVPKMLGANYPVAALCVVLCLAGTMIVSLLSYRLVEIPGRDLLRALLLPRRPPQPKTT